MAAVAFALKVGYFASTLLLLGKLGSFVVEPTYLVHVFADFFTNTNPVIVTIVHRAYNDHPKVFVA